VLQNVTRYVDTGISPASTYKYRVAANNVVGYTRQYAAPAVGFQWEVASSAALESAAVVTP
jgi:hypothetical protein